MNRYPARQVEAEASQHPVQRAALDGREPRRIADRAPEALKRGARAVTPAAFIAVGQTTAFIAPALVPLISAISRRSSSSRRSRTPQVSAPCDPPP
jgi:hypothetical protein